MDMKCKACGAEISEHARFCTKCGASQTIEKVEEKVPLFCTKCGTKLKPGARFCTGCGAEVVKKVILPERVPEQTIQEEMKPETSATEQTIIQEKTEMMEQDEKSERSATVEKAEEFGQPEASKKAEKPQQSVLSEKTIETEEPVMQKKMEKPQKSTTLEQPEQKQKIEYQTKKLKTTDETPAHDVVPNTPVNKKGQDNKKQLIAIVIVIVVILATLITGTVILCNQLLNEPTQTEKSDRNKDESSTEQGDSTEATSEAASEETTTEIDLSTVDYDLTANNVLTLEGNVLQSASDGKVISLPAPVKFYGANESGVNILVENVSSVILNGQSLPVGMLDSIGGNTAVKVSGKVSISAGKVSILVDTVQDGKGKDLIAKYEAGDDEDYILPYSSDEYLTEDDIEDLSLQEINYAKNEIYARHGRKFDSKELRDYFESKDWYDGTIDPGDFKESSLSKIERANVQLLKDKEFSIDPKGYQLD